MAKNPSSVWYWNDWLLDPGVRMCSMAARGFWLEMLALAAAATPYGHVVINGTPCSICDLATATNQRKQDVSRWVRELEKRGVFSRTENGTIFCRRMVREAELRRAKASHHRKARPPRVAHPPEVSNQPELLDNPSPNHEKRADSDSDSVAVSQTHTPISNPPTSPPDAARATLRQAQTPQQEGGEKISGNPEARAARLGRSGERPLDVHWQPPKANNHFRRRTWLNGRKHGLLHWVQCKSPDDYPLLTRALWICEWGHWSRDLTPDQHERIDALDAAAKADPLVFEMPEERHKRQRLEAATRDFCTRPKAETADDPVAAVNALNARIEASMRRTQARRALAIPA